MKSRLEFPAANSLEWMWLTDKLEECFEPRIYCVVQLFYLKPQLNPTPLLSVSSLCLLLILVIISSVVWQCGHLPLKVFPRIISQGFSVGNYSLRPGRHIVPTCFCGGERGGGSFLLYLQLIMLRVSVAFFFSSHLTLTQELQQPANERCERKTNSRLLLLRLMSWWMTLCECRYCRPRNICLVTQIISNSLMGPQLSSFSRTEPPSPASMKRCTFWSQSKAP